MSKSKHQTITEAQHAVMEQIKMLDKDAQAHDFQYTSAAFALLVLRPLMLNHSISKFRVETRHCGRWQNGIGVDYTLVFRYQLTGTTELIPGVTYQDVFVEASGKVGKSGDKSTFAAQTTGSKYADLDFFNLPMTDDIEGFEEAAEYLEEKYSDLPGSDTETKNEETVYASSSSGISYNDGVLDLIQQLYDEGGEDAVTEFTKGDRRKKVKELVKELLENAEEAEPEEEEEEEEAPKKSPKSSGKKSSKKKPKPKEDEDEDGEVSLDDIDYDDEDMVNALFEQVDIEDDEVITTILSTGFTDPEALKAFYTVCVERAGEVSADFQDEFNEGHFETLQVKFEDLVD